MVIDRAEAEGTGQLPSGAELLQPGDRRVESRLVEPDLYDRMGRLGRAMQSPLLSIGTLGGSFIVGTILRTTAGMAQGIEAVIDNAEGLWNKVSGHDQPEVGEPVRRNEYLRGISDTLEQGPLSVVTLGTSYLLGKAMRATLAIGERLHDEIADVAEKVQAISQPFDRDGNPVRDRRDDRTTAEAERFEAVMNGQGGEALEAPSKSEPPSRAQEPQAPEQPGTLKAALRELDLSPFVVDTHGTAEPKRAAESNNRSTAAPEQKTGGRGRG
jgi:hypothetical protein